MKNKSFTALAIIIALFAFSTYAHAQTTYEDDPGFFTPVLESFYLQGGVFEETQLIGPAFGYRFNSNYDAALHTEFLFSESNFNNRSNPELSILNLGLIIGQTKKISNQNLLRTEASVYKSLNLSVENYSDLSSPSLISVLGSSAFYKQLQLSGSTALLPNLGVIAGVGDYQAPYSSANLRQGFDGVVVGPQFGVDALFDIGDSFSITAKPQYQIRYNFSNEQSVGTLTFNIQINL